MWWFVVACVGPAVVLSAVTTAIVRRWAPRWGLIDQPAARKVHVTPTPLGGGIGIWVGVIAPIALAQLVAWLLLQQQELPAWFPAELQPHLEGVLYRSGQMWAILACGSVLAVMGLVDDLKNLPWQPRLGIQLAVAILLVFVVGVRATVFVPWPLLGSVLTVLWILVLTNAFNFLDNMDALSGGMACIAASMFAIVMLTGTSEPRWLVGGMLLILAGSLAGFLIFHNWPPARIFMGDSGSHFIGMLLATLTILGTYYEYDPTATTNSTASRHVILAPLCILAVPLYDFCSVMIIRLKQGRSPFHADKSHFSHRLVELGFTRRGAVLTIHLATLTTGLGALLLYQVSDWTGAGLVVALIACVLSIVALLEYAGRNRGT